MGGLISAGQVDKNYELLARGNKNIPQPRIWWRSGYLPFHSSRCTPFRSPIFRFFGSSSVVRHIDRPIPCQSLPTLHPQRLAAGAGYSVRGYPVHCAAPEPSAAGSDEGDALTVHPPAPEGCASGRHGERRVDHVETPLPLVGALVLVLVLVLVFARAQSLPIFNRCISRLLPARASWLPRHYGVVMRSRSRSRSRSRLVRGSIVSDVY